MLRFLTAGESHGQGLVALLEGMPAGLQIDLDAITVPDEQAWEEERRPCLLY